MFPSFSWAQLGHLMSLNLPHPEWPACMEDNLNWRNPYWIQNASTYSALLLTAIWEKFFTFVRTTAIPLSSEAFSSKTRDLNSELVQLESRLIGYTRIFVFQLPGLWRFFQCQEVRKIGDEVTDAIRTAMKKTYISGLDGPLQGRDHLILRGDLIYRFWTTGCSLEQRRMLNSLFFNPRNEIWFNCFLCWGHSRFELEYSFSTAHFCKNPIPTKEYSALRTRHIYLVRFS